MSLISYSGIHQLHIFIFVLAFMHVLYSVILMVLGHAKVSSFILVFTIIFPLNKIVLLINKMLIDDTFFLSQMKKWKKWELETSSTDYQFNNGKFF